MGAAGGHLLGTGNLDEPVAFPMRPSNFERSATPLTFETPADLLLASDSRINMRAARHAPGSSLEGKSGTGTSKDLVEC